MKKKIKKRFLMLVFMVLTGIFSLIFLNIFKNSIWDAKNNLNFIIEAGERTFIYSYHPREGMLNIISLPSDLVVETARGYGQYQLKNIFSLGQMQKYGGGELLQISLQQFFSVPIDAYLVKTSGRSFKINRESLEKGKLTSIFFCLVRGKCKTNLSWGDLLRLQSRIAKLKLNELKLINIEETSLYKKDKLADGTEISTIKQSLIDEFVQKYFSDKGFLDDGLKISILNATNFSGLAKKAGGLLKNIGGEIVSSQDADEASEDSVIYLSDKENKESYTLKRISKIFRIKKIEYSQEIRGDVCLVLGKEYLKIFYLK
ncbi:MAG TPA: LytR C-terminal domain-containing protein [Candidatus Bathyarchaeia archaeon]|nr:LytR C-terminal domain-containing protein [Candidatus Bathyarchaeia archaeon]